MAKPQLGDVLSVRYGSIQVDAEVRGGYTDWQGRSVLVLLIPGNNMPLQRYADQFMIYRSDKVQKFSEREGSKMGGA